MPGETKSCEVCFWRPVPSAAAKYCSNACRQRAYRARQHKDDGVAVANALVEVLSPERIESYPPHVRDFMRKVLKRALRTL
jgi:hypothetical protein